MIAGKRPEPLDRRAWQQAAALREAGYEVSVICPKSHRAEPDHAVIGGIAVYRHALPPQAGGVLASAIGWAWGPCLTFWLAWRVLLTRGFDIVHGGHPLTTVFFVAGFFKLLLGKQFVFDHGEASPADDEALRGRWDVFHRLPRRLMRWTFRAADICLAANHSGEADAAGAGGMRLERVFVLRSGPTLNDLAVAPPRPDTALKNGRAFLIACAGPIGHAEGIDALLRSVAHIALALERQDVHFAVAGDGPALDEMKQLAIRLGVEAHVSFTGPLDETALLTLLGAADLCVNPRLATIANDRFTDCRVLDFMALRKPIVQFDLTEARVSAGDAALYAEPNDPVDLAEQMLALLADPDRRVRMGACGYRRLREELAWDYLAPKLIAAYAALGRLRFKLPVPEPEHLRAPRIRSQIARPIRAAE